MQLKERILKALMKKADMNLTPSQEFNLKDESPQLKARRAIENFSLRFDQSLAFKQEEKKIVVSSEELVPVSYPLHNQGNYQDT